MCIIFHTLGNGYLKFGPDLRGNQTLIQDSLTIKRNCFCNFHWGPFRMYLSDINFGLLCGFTPMVRNFIVLFIGKNYFRENSCKDVLRCVCSKKCTVALWSFSSSVSLTVSYESLCLRHVTVRWNSWKRNSNMEFDDCRLYIVLRNMFICGYVWNGGMAF